MFDYDWFYGVQFERQKQEAKRRCAIKKLSQAGSSPPIDEAEVGRLCAELETRTLMYLRDGFSYELKDLAEVESKSHLTFECEPVDEHYKVGAFIVSVPFDDIVRVEVFAVHPSEKPEDVPMITGFRTSPEQPVPRDDAMHKS